MRRKSIVVRKNHEHIRSNYTQQLRYALNWPLQAETKWPPISWWHIHCLFLNEKYDFRLIFHWSLILRFELTIFQHWFRQWFGANQATSYYLNQWWLPYWHIYVSLDFNELTRRITIIMYITILNYTIHRVIDYGIYTKSLWNCQWILRLIWANGIPIRTNFNVS